MKINPTYISPVARLSSTNDGQRQAYDRAQVVVENNFSERRRARPQSADYVFRGEFIESVGGDKRYNSDNPNARSQSNTQNYQAISRYQSTSVVTMGTESLGRVIDRFI